MGDTFVLNPPKDGEDGRSCFFKLLRALQALTATASDGAGEFWYQKAKPREVRVWTIV